MSCTSSSLFRGAHWSCLRCVTGLGLLPLSLTVGSFRSSRQQYVIFIKLTEMDEWRNGCTELTFNIKLREDPPPPPTRISEYYITPCAGSVNATSCVGSVNTTPRVGSVNTTPCVGWMNEYNTLCRLSFLTTLLCSFRSVTVVASRADGYCQFHIVAGNPVRRKPLHKLGRVLFALYPPWFPVRSCNLTTNQGRENLFFFFPFFFSFSLF